jgi:hypothetical protein
VQLTEIQISSDWEVVGLFAESLDVLLNPESLAESCLRRSDNFGGACLLVEVAERLTGYLFGADHPEQLIFVIGKVVVDPLSERIVNHVQVYQP